MVRRLPYPLIGRSCFDLNIGRLFYEYEAIAVNLGWGISDIKSMVARERRYWCSLIEWRISSG